jgi:antitoxin PrlF
MLAVGKITAKGQSHDPAGRARCALHVAAGDLIAWEVGADGTATVRRVQPLDLEYLRAVEGTLSEWAGAAPTRRPIVSFDRFAVVRVPFPFTDRDTPAKNRPALVLSDASGFQHAGRSFGDGR